MNLRAAILRMVPGLGPASDLPLHLDNKDDSPKWGNTIRLDPGVQNSPRASLRVLNFSEETTRPATRCITLASSFPRFAPGTVPDDLDIHPVALVTGGTGAGFIQFELDWIHGAQFTLALTSCVVALTFDVPADPEAIVPPGILFGAFIAPFASPAMRPRRSYRLATIAGGAGQSAAVLVPPLARRWRLYAADPDDLAAVEQQLWRNATPSIVAAQAAGEWMDIFGPTQLAAAVNTGDDPVPDLWAIFELAA